MTGKLLFEAIIKVLAGIILVGLLIFFPAGTIHFTNGWILMLLLFVPMFVAGIVMMITNPELLKRRLNAKEQQKEQSVVVIISGVMFVLGFVVAGLDFRFGWSDLPMFLTICASVVFIVGYLLYAEVIRENEYLNRTIQVEENQKVIDTGLYGIVRHPMYSATLLLFLSMPIILGSLWSFIIFLVYPFVIAIRIKFEEKFLEKELIGYTEYKKKIKYRMIPHIW